VQVNATECCHFGEGMGEAEGVREVAEGHSTKNNPEGGPDAKRRRAGRDTFGELFQIAHKKMPALPPENAGICSATVRSGPPSLSPSISRNCEVQAGKLHPETRVGTVYCTTIAIFADICFQQVRNAPASENSKNRITITNFLRIGGVGERSRTPRRSAQQNAPN